MPGRKLLIIINNDNGSGGGDPGNTRVVVGGPDIVYDVVGGHPNTINGYLLEIYESISLPVDDNVIVYAIQDSDTTDNEGDADLRTIELA